MDVNIWMLIYGYEYTIYDMNINIWKLMISWMLPFIYVYMMFHLVIYLLNPG